MATLEDLEKMLLLAAEQIPEKALTIIEVEGKNFIQKNFQDQGFTDSGLDKWEERKTTDKKGRDITTYRTNRRGKKGSLNKYGSDNKDRAILVGKGTGGNKLKNSIKSRVNKSTKEVRYYTDKKYAARHNEGLDGMKERKFMGKSKYLEGKISDKLKRELDKIFK